jgi:hypothetical protein
MRCYQKNQWWAACKETCTPGIDPTDAPEFQLPWDCTPLGDRSSGSPASVKHDQVVVKVRQGLLPQNAETGTEVILTVGGKKVRAKIVSVKRGVQGTTASSSGVGSSASAGGSAVWSVLSFLLTLMALGAVGLWAWRSRAGDAAPEWLKNFPNAGGATSALERWRRGQVVTTPKRPGGGAAQQSPMPSPQSSPQTVPPAPPTSTWPHCRILCSKGS